MGFGYCCRDFRARLSVFPTLAISFAMRVRLILKKAGGVLQALACSARAAAIGTIALGAVLGNIANAQETTVERSAKGLPARDIQVGLYLNVQPDCTSGTLPAIRLLAPPANGTVTIKRGKVTATNYKQCLALEVPGFIAFYKSKPEFSGVDIATIEVKYPSGRTEIQRISITIGDGKGGQKI
jgi:hypothetical protein